MKWFTSDQHINDKNILQYQYDRTEIFGKTNKTIIQNLIKSQNCQVEPDHIVYMLGDFIVAENFNEFIKILNKLNGKIHLLLGNHDTLLKNIKVNLPNKLVIYNDILPLTLNNGYEIYMFHYPLLEQPNYYNSNTYHLYGHTHGRRFHPDKRALEISFNLYEYKLLSENKIIELLNLK